MSIIIGKNIGPYQIQKEIFFDGFSRAYQAIDTRLERIVIVKAAEVRHLGDDLVQRFEREARILATLNHPNIVKIFDYGEYDGLPYLVLEYIQGISLKERFGSLTMWQDAARLLLPIAHALEYAHQNHVFHWNVRLSSILVTSTGKPMLSDFGISWLLKSEEIDDPVDNERFYVTYEFMSPERAHGEDEDHRTDIYSLGMVFYELITGELPFDAETPIAYLVQVIEGKIRNPRKLVPDLPTKVENVLNKSIASNPVDRFQSMKEFANALDTLVNMAEKPLKAFLCHSSKDKLYVRELYKRLINSGIDAWFDEESLMPGQEWEEEIKKAVRKCDVVIVCLSKSSISKAGFVQKEIRYALDIADEEPDGSIFIIPLRLEICEPPTRLGKWQWVDIFAETGFDKLLSALEKRRKELQDRE